MSARIIKKRAVGVASETCLPITNGSPVGNLRNLQWSLLLNSFAFVPQLGPVLYYCLKDERVVLSFQDPPPCRKFTPRCNSTHLAKHTLLSECEIGVEQIVTRDWRWIGIARKFLNAGWSWWEFTVRIRVRFQTGVQASACWKAVYIPADQPVKAGRKKTWALETCCGYGGTDVTCRFDSPKVILQQIVTWWLILLHMKLLLLLEFTYERHSAPCLLVEHEIERAIPFLSVVTGISNHHSGNDTHWYKPSKLSDGGEG